MTGARPQKDMPDAPRGACAVIVPTLNEGGNVDRLLERVLRVAAQTDLALEVVVVDDGSEDDTRERVRAWTRAHPVKLVCREREGGLAGAVLAGAAATSADVVAVMDADLSHPPEKLPDLLRLVLEDHADMAVGSRYVPGGRSPGWPLRRRIISRGAALLASPFADARDPLSGFFAVRRALLLEAGREATGFKIGLQVAARAGEGLSVVEVPIRFQDRSWGESKLGTRVVRTYLRQLADLAGAAATATTALRFAAISLVGLAVDLSVFLLCVRAGVELGASHLASFAAATISNYLLGVHWAFRQGEASAAGSRRIASFALVATLAATLRGGVLATLARSWGWSPLASILPAIAAAALVNYVGCAFFVFAGRSSAPTRETRWRLAALAAVTLLFALRLAYASAVDLLPQEAYYWNYSQHLDIGYLDHPPMVAWIIRLGTLVAGQTELGVRLGAVLCSLVAMLFVARLTQSLFGRAAAYRTALLAVTLPFFFGTGFLMTPDAPLVACWAGTVCFLERALIGGKRSAWWGAGLGLGLGMLSKYSIALLAFSAFIYMVLDRRSRRWLASPVPYGAAAVALAVFSPVILWNVRHEWASFAFQSTQRWEGEGVFELHILVLSMVGLFTPLGIWGFVEGLRGARGEARRFGLVFTLVPLAAFVISSLHNETKLNWTGPVWLAALPFVARSLLPRGAAAPGAPLSTARALQAGPSRALELSWKPVLVVLALGYGLFLHFQALGLPGVPYMRGRLNMSWRDLATQVGAIERDVEDRTRQKPLTVGLDKYNISSELAFYNPAGDGARTTAGKSLFGKISLMYGYWFPPEEQAGRSLVLVCDNLEALERQSLRSRFESFEPIREIAVRRGETVVAQFFAQVAHGYEPPPDAKGASDGETPR